MTHVATVLHATLFAYLPLSSPALAHSLSVPSRPDAAEERVAAALTEYIGHLTHTPAPPVHWSAPVPSFSRQTGLACSACHTRFPQLNALGRDFKLNGYTLTAQQVIQEADSGGAGLRLDLVPPLSGMIITSLTSTQRSVPGTQNRSAAFPQEMGLFFAGGITTNLGAFLQLTYDPSSGGIGLDNADVRFAGHTRVAGTDVLAGLTLNDAPGVQDLWNSTPVWGFPFASSDVAPSAAASVLLDGGLDQTAVGLGSYALWDNRLYTEATLYRSAFQGGPVPVDGSASDVIHGVAPYWRAALQHPLGETDLMLGTYGMVANLTPTGFEGARDRYVDVGVDGQIQRPLTNGGALVAHGTWIHERRTLDATRAADGSSFRRGHLDTARLDAMYAWSSRWAATAGVFSTTGSADPGLYAPAAVSGSSNGRPDTRGLTAMLTFTPWLNTRLGLEYTAYTSFNGRGSDYDGSGRAASDNNTLYLMTWLVF
ncbi:MAG: cytochrome C [Gemmatimonadota bacterium]